MPDYEERLSKFERMCVVKTFREDRTLVAAADYISDALGQRFVESVPLNMERAWAESHKKCPLICLLSPGNGLLRRSVPACCCQTCSALLCCLYTLGMGSQVLGYLLADDLRLPPKCLPLMHTCPVSAQPPGSDPTKLIEDLAKRKKIKTLGVSMGQGQEVIARKLMATAAAEGQWLLLQNTHLGLGYLTEVEQYLIKAEDLHEDFR